MMEAMKMKPLLFIMLSVGQVLAQVDPFKGEPDPSPPPPNLLTRYEAFSMDLKQAADLQREDPTDAALYEQVVAAVAGGAAAQESLMVLRSRSGMKAVTDSSREIIYPTEYMPVFRKDFTAGEPPVSTVTSLLGTAFETRGAGDRLEIEVVLGDAGRIRLKTLVSHVKFLGTSKYGQGASEAEVPLFSVQSINTAAMIKAGVPFLLGKTNSREAAGEVTKPDGRVWFSFATVDITQP